MIFSAKKWNNGKELKAVMKVNTAISFDMMEAPLRNAFRQYLVPLLGDAMAGEVVEIYEFGPNPDVLEQNTEEATEREKLDSRLLEICKRANANLAFWNDFDEISMRITDAGFQRQKSDNGESFQQVYKYQEDNLRASLRNKGFNALDELLEFLYAHIAEYPEFASSQAYQDRKSAIVRSTADVNDVCFINGSRIVFLRLQPHLKFAEEMLLQPAIGDKLYEHLIDGLVNPPEDEEARKSMERLRQINGELALLPVKFGNNVLRATNDFVLKLTDKQLDGLPASVQGIAREKAAELGLNDAWVVTLDAPSRIPFLTYSTQRDLREQLYKAYIDRCNEGSEYDNRSLVNDFARLRNEKARLLGYPSYAAYVTADEMAGTPAAVYELLNEVWTPALDRAKEEMAEMNTMLQRDVPGATFEPWDWWYYAEKVRKDKYALDDATLRPYFSLENVREGAFSLANRLYGITFRPLVAPVYHKDCSVYEVLDVDGTHLGVLYFDFFPRSGKSSGAWCTAFRSQRYEGDERIAPVVAIVCNFTPPTKLTPSLLTLDEVQTLFHEFGHGLHALFADVKYRSLGRVEGDFVELPSQIMENWATEKEFLDLWAVNYKTGEPIPADLIAKIVAAENYQAAYFNVRQLLYGLNDMAWHSIDKPFEGDVELFERTAMAPAQVLPVVEGAAMSPAFSHIFAGGYAAGYYGYKWAEVLAADAFSLFKEKGIFNPEVAEAFRREILSKGGHEHPMTLYVNFRGHKPETKALIEKMGLEK